MRSLVYVLKTGYKNMIRRAVKKPSFYIYAALLLLYAWFLWDFFHSLVVEAGFNSPQILAMAITALTLYFTPGNYITYAKRKGLRFLPPHVHFMFASPTSPKLLLLFAQIQTQFINILIEVLVVLAGIFWFHIPLPQMLGYFLLISCFGLVFNGALVICLYGNERFGERTIRLLSSALWLVIAGLVGITALYLYKNGISLESILGFLLSDWICLIPVIGWEAACIRLVLLGDLSAVTVLCAACYLLFGTALIVLACRMRCTGEYFENAMKFADDYQQMMNRRKKGDVSLGKGMINKKATVSYRGSGAKAIFFRQLLEYKKSRFFIFGGQTLLSLIVAAALVVLLGIGELHITGLVRYYAIYGIIAYICLIFGNFRTKWEKELESPYVYLIPAGNFAKMWYATLLEHVKSAVDALILAVPYCIVLDLPIAYALVITAAAVSMKAVKLYADTLCAVLLGKSLGDTARQLLRMLISWTLILIAVPVVVVVQFFAGPAVAVLGGCAYLLAAAVGLMAGGSYAFSNLDTGLSS